MDHGISLRAPILMVHASEVILTQWHYVS